MQWLFPFIIIWSLCMVLIGIRYWKLYKCPSLMKCE